MLFYKNEFGIEYTTKIDMSLYQETTKNIRLFNFHNDSSQHFNVMFHKQNNCIKVFSRHLFAQLTNFWLIKIVKL